MNCQDLCAWPVLDRCSSTEGGGFVPTPTCDLRACAYCIRWLRHKGALVACRWRGAPFSDFSKMPRTGGQVPTVTVAPACTAESVCGAIGRDVIGPTNKSCDAWGAVRAREGACLHSYRTAHATVQACTPQQGLYRWPNRNQSSHRRQRRRLSCQSDRGQASCPARMSAAHRRVTAECGCQQKHRKRLQPCREGRDPGLKVWRAYLQTTCSNGVNFELGRPTARSDGQRGQAAAAPCTFLWAFATPLRGCNLASGSERLHQMPT
jgi:hypothetical protein